jgi:predicted nucleic acid-binding protein
MHAKPVVVDASVVVKWVIPEEYSENALRLLNDHLDGKIEAHAPCLVVFEAASALRKYVLRGILSEQQAREAMKLIWEAEPVIEYLDAQQAAEALSLSLELGITPYDAAYLVLAKRLGAILFSADEKLLANPKIADMKIVKHIASYE